ncbi:hypothetical protein Hanom_Chr02g00124811 [Helianthus anomalus]
MLAWSAVVGSCNGILCLHYYDNVSLWNLSIRHRVRVPNSPLLSIAGVGFGFDPITDDYKIVAIDFNEHKTCVYPSSRLLYTSISKPYFLNGISHWVPQKSTPDSIYIDIQSMVSSEDGDSWKIRVMGEYGKTESWSLLFEMENDPLCMSAAFQPIINNHLFCYK